jgi:hypothetical protein
VLVLVRMRPRADAKVRVQQLQANCQRVSAERSRQPDVRIPIRQVAIV